MTTSRLPLRRKAIVAGVFGDKGWSHFLEAHFLPQWLPLIFGLCTGLILAFLIVNELWHLAIPLALIVPAAILFSRHPFVGVMLWLLLLPYFLNEPTAAGRVIFWILHRAIIPAALGVALISGWLGIRDRPTLSLSRAELAMPIFLGLALVSILLFNEHPISATIKLYDLLFIPFCMYWLIRLTEPSSEYLKIFIGIAFITVLAQCVIGLLSWFAPEVLPFKWRTGLEGARTVGTLRNPAVFTSTLLFLSLLLFHYAMHGKSTALRLGLLLTFGLVMYCVFMSFSRGSWVGGSIILVGLMFFYPKAVIRLTIIVFLLVYLLSSSVLADQVAWAYERATGAAARETAESRLITNNASFSMIAAKPLFGWGFGNYDRYDRRFQTRVGDVPVRNDMTSHNTYFSIMAEMGLIGFLFYFFPVVWWLLLSIKFWRQLPRDGFWSRRLLVMLWLLLLHMAIVTMVMDMVRFHPFGTTIWWAVLALIGNMVHPYLEARDVGAATWSKQLVGRV
jgi:O-antigen ligase